MDDDKLRSVKIHTWTVTQSQLRLLNRDDTINISIDNTKIVKDMLLSVNPKIRLNFILHQSYQIYYNRALCRRYRCKTLRLILESVSRDDILQLLQMKDSSNGMAALLLAAARANTLEMILKSVSSDRLQLLQMKDNYGMTLLHHVAHTSASELVKVMLKPGSNTEQFCPA